MFAHTITSVSTSGESRIGLVLLDAAPTCFGRDCRGVWDGRERLCCFEKFEDDWRRRGASRRPSPARVGEGEKAGKVIYQKRRRVDVPCHSAVQNKKHLRSQVMWNRTRDGRCSPTPRATTNEEWAHRPTHRTQWRDCAGSSLGETSGKTIAAQPFPAQRVRLLLWNNHLLFVNAGWLAAVALRLLSCNPMKPPPLAECDGRM
jgi:hypothetical protein